ncbi:sulfite oxidase subunit YedZ [Escherichia coli]|uniref:Sulfite oxidase subunit YedZ n=1 Tax=Escherichia coli TaxID=562 RepID=A0A377C6V3_ECOLX|nr:sulfite oxidase subunit YedZ [Escherichia coli]
MIRLRRLLGLWCFAWATLRLAPYLFLVPWVNNLILFDYKLTTQTYLMLSIVSRLILRALAFHVYPDDAVKLGNPQQPLRNVVYLVAILASLHYLWSVKIISLQPLIFTGLALQFFTLRYKKFRR